MTSEIESDGRQEGANGGLMGDEWSVANLFDTRRGR
jgi:hypothetical protein